MSDCYIFSPAVYIFRPGTNGFIHYLSVSQNMQKKIPYAYN